MADHRHKTSYVATAARICEVRGTWPSCFVPVAHRKAELKPTRRPSGALDQRDDIGAGRVGAEVQARGLELVQLPQQTQLQLRAGTEISCTVATMLREVTRKHQAWQGCGCCGSAVLTDSNNSDTRNHWCGCCTKLRLRIM